jgi:hypothetical protein
MTVRNWPVHLVRIIEYVKIDGGKVIATMRMQDIGLYRLMWRSCTEMSELPCAYYKGS